MKKSKSNSKNKYIIIVNLFLIAILMVVGVYAWFAVSVDNRVNAYDVQVNSDSNLELSFDQTNWSTSLNLADYDEFANVKFVEVTGTGSSTGAFRVPQLTQNGNYATVKTNGTWKDAEKNKDYLEFKVYMRSKDKLNVYLGSESSASPSSKVITGSNSGNKSSYGDFSKDCIVGALRLSACNRSAFKFLWITNPELHLDNAVGSDTYAMTTNATAASNASGTGAAGNNYKWNNSYEHWYYRSDNSTLTKFNGAITEIPSTTGSTEPGVSYQIANLTGTADDKGYYSSYATFMVWIEGCDNEARRALVGGKFNLTLTIDAFSAE